MKVHQAVEIVKNAQGIFHNYSDVKTISFCHTKIIEIPSINAEHLNEIKNMMKTQHEFWTKHLHKAAI
jgi:hypothetical protein